MSVITVSSPAGPHKDTDRLLWAGLRYSVLSLMASVANGNDTHQERSVGDICPVPCSLKLPVIPATMSWLAHLGVVGSAGTVTNDRVWSLPGNNMHLSV